VFLLIVVVAVVTTLLRSVVAAGKTKAFKLTFLLLLLSFVVDVIFVVGGGGKTELFFLRFSFISETVFGEFKLLDVQTVERNKSCSLLRKSLVLFPSFRAELLLLHRHYRSGKK